jgi:hypothetical protein
MPQLSPELTLRQKADAISRRKKERFLLSLSEDDFRDRAVRPLFHRRGLRDGRDVCGPDEEGKDAIFIATDALGLDDVIVVQTKSGNLNLARKASQNLENAVTQLRTALATKVSLLASKQKKLPSKAILCASGAINEAARKHVIETVDSPHVVFLDRDELIPLIDQDYPELWLDIDAEILPYMRGLRSAIETASETIAITEMLPTAGAAASDQLFVTIHVWKTAVALKKQKGMVRQTPKFENVPVTDLVEKDERLILLLGDAGVGKSTCIRRLAYVLAGRRFEIESETRIPVLLRAVDVARQEMALADLCARETQRIGNSSNTAFTAEDLESGQLVVLIDALDELQDDGERQYVVNRVLEFNDRYSACQVIATSREYGTLKGLEGYDSFDRYRVSKIDYKQAEEMVDRLEKKGSLPKNASKEVIRRLQDVHGMDLNPLLVAVFAATTEYSRQDIPANITELFKKFTEMMLGRWDASKGFAHQYQAPVKDFVLTRIAYDMHWRGTTQVSVEAFRMMLEAELTSRGHEANVEELLDEIINRSGLLRTVGDHIEFRHLLLQEFFAGRGIPSEDLLEKLIFDEWWRRALVFYFGERPSSTNALEKTKQAIAARPKEERFVAAVTLGLAAQACYLVPVKEKLAVFVGVIEDLADAKEYIHDRESESRFPLTRFLGYYLYGRDSVASSLLGTHWKAISEKWQRNDDDLSEADRDARIFWLVVGLIESGALEEAEALAEKFRPSDPRLLLGLHLGCFLVQHLRISTRAQRRCAARICGNLEGYTAGLLKQVQDEFKSRMLEIRSGAVAAIPEQNLQPNEDD